MLTTLIREPIFPSPHESNRLFGAVLNDEAKGNGCYIKLFRVGEINAKLMVLVAVMPNPFTGEDYVSVRIVKVIRQGIGYGKPGVPGSRPFRAGFKKTPRRIDVLCRNHHVRTIQNIVSTP